MSYPDEHAKHGRTTSGQQGRPQVTGALSMLNKQIAQFKAAINTLEERMAPVLRPPLPPEARGKPPDIVVPLAKEIIDSTSSLAEIYAEVQAVIQRLEI